MEALIKPYLMRIFWALGDVLFSPSTQQNWPQDRKLTRSKIIEIGFQNAVSTSVSKCLCDYSAMMEAQMQWLRFRARENPAFLSVLVFSFITFNFDFYSMLWGIKIIRLLSFRNGIRFSFYFVHSSHSYSSHCCCFFKQTMNAEFSL